MCGDTNVQERSLAGGRLLGTYWIPTQSSSVAANAISLGQSLLVLKQHWEENDKEAADEIIFLGSKFYEDLYLEYIKNTETLYKTLKQTNKQKGKILKQVLHKTRW